MKLIKLSIILIQTLTLSKISIPGTCFTPLRKRKLLRSEANLGLKNWKEETPIVHIAPDIMEEYLDDCLEGEELSTSDKFKITFKYHFLGPPRMKFEDQQPLLEGKVTDT